MVSGCCCHGLPRNGRRWRGWRSGGRDFAEKRPLLESMRPSAFLSRVWERLDSRFTPFGTTVIFENPRTAARLLLAVGFGAALNLTIVAIWLSRFGETGATLVVAGTAALYLVITGWFFTTGRARRPLITLLWLSVANHVAVHMSLGVTHGLVSGSVGGSSLRQQLPCSLVNARRSCSQVCM